MSNGSFSSASGSPSTILKANPNDSMLYRHENVENIEMEEEDVFYPNLNTFPSNMCYAESENDQTFLNSLIAIENDYVEKLQTDLEQTGIIKRLVHLRFNFDLRELKQLIVDLVDQECKALILWAKCIPEFGALPIEDQTYSIELNFLEVILIDCLWRSISNSNKEKGLESNNSSENDFVLNENLILNRSTCKDLNMSDIYDHFASIVVKLNKMCLTKEEYICLKALVLFKSDYGFIDVDRLEQLRSKCMKILRQTAMKACKANQKLKHSIRFESILLFLADIKSISMRFMHHLIQFNISNSKIQLPNLLNDMFLTQNMFGLTAKNFLINFSSEFNENFNNSKNNISIKMDHYRDQEDFEKIDCVSDEQLIDAVSRPNSTCSSSERLISKIQSEQQNFRLEDEADDANSFNNSMSFS